MQAAQSPEGTPRVLGDAIHSSKSIEHLATRSEHAVTPSTSPVAMNGAPGGPPLTTRRPAELSIPPLNAPHDLQSVDGDSADPLLKTPTLNAPPSPSLYRPAPDYVDPLVTLAPTPASLSALVCRANADQVAALRPSLRLGAQQPITESKVREVFTAAYLRAASSGDSDLLEWMLAKPSGSPSLTAVPTRPSPRLGSASATPKIGSAQTQERTLKPGEAKGWIDLDAKDPDGSPAIVLAAAFGHTEAVRAIIDGCGSACIDAKDACALSLSIRLHSV